MSIKATQPEAIYIFWFKDGEHIRYWTHDKQQAERVAYEDERAFSTFLATPSPQPATTKEVGSEAWTRPRLQLERWGRSEKETGLLLTRMEDGYWTPWHIAQVAVDLAAAAQPAEAKTAAEDSDAKNAKRYRFLRDEAYQALIPHGGKLDGSRTAWITKLHPGGTFDNAIDDAIATQEGGR